MLKLVLIGNTTPLSRRVTLSLNEIPCLPSPEPVYRPPIHAACRWFIRSRGYTTIRGFRPSSSSFRQISARNGGHSYECPLWQSLRVQVQNSIIELANAMKCASRTNLPWPAQLSKTTVPAKVKLYWPSLSGAKTVPFRLIRYVKIYKSMESALSYSDLLQ